VPGGPGTVSPSNFAQAMPLLDVVGAIGHSRRWADGRGVFAAAGPLGIAAIAVVAAAQARFPVLVPFDPGIDRRRRDLAARIVGMFALQGSVDLFRGPLLSQARADGLARFRAVQLPLDRPLLPPPLVLIAGLGRVVFTCSQPPCGFTAARGPGLSCLSDFRPPSEGAPGGVCAAAIEMIASPSRLTTGLRSSFSRPRRRPWC
jgi:hypothetical protein